MAAQGLYGGYSHGSVPYCMVCVQISLPESPGWWLVFDVSFEELEDIALSVLEMAARPKKTLEEVEKEVARIKEARTEEQKGTGDTTKEVVRSSSLPASTDGECKSCPLFQLCVCG